MKVLVTGGKGQLGSAVERQCLEAGLDVIAYGRHDLDILNEVQVMTVLSNEKPDVVVHCAAYTNVDQAEEEPTQAFRINAIGTRNLVTVARRINAKFVYVSTDYVFDGTAEKPLDEWQATSPLGVYGRSKLAGESFVRELHSRFFIVRTSWVFGHQGNNFVKTMIKLSGKKKELKVVADQIGSPTYAEDLAEAIVALIGTERYGTYHISNSGACSWYEFACKIFQHVRTEMVVLPCSTAEFPRPAARPAYSVLAHQALELNGFLQMRTWEEALMAYFQKETFVP